MSNTSNVHYLHGTPRPIAQFLRVGRMHKQLEEMRHQGRLPVTRFVFDAGRVLAQSDLFATLRQDGRELVLDTNVAELSAIAHFKGFAQHAPWASANGALSPVHFTSRANELDNIGRISRFAISHSFDRVLSPSGAIKTINDEWLSASVEACNLLRRSLDRDGGQQIAIGFSLIVTNAMLNDVASRKAIISKIEGAPFESIWMRISGFGADATGVAIRKYISAVQEFHELGKPIVADCVGGLAAQAIVAFGAVSGIAHGLASKERFDASSWDKPRKPGGGGGEYTFLMPGIDRLLGRNDAEALIASSGARKHFSCSDRSCCTHGFEDTEKDVRGHYLRQRAKSFQSLSAVHEAVRSQHFVAKELVQAERYA